MSTENETLIINPHSCWIAGQKDAAMFFGRGDEYARLRQHLWAPTSTTPLCSTGSGAAAKTSVLYQMKDVGDPLYIPVLLDLQGMGLEGLDGFLWEVARKIVLALRGVESIPSLERPARQSFDKNPRHHSEERFFCLR